MPKVAQSLAMTKTLLVVVADENFVVIEKVINLVMRLKVTEDIEENDS